MRRQTSSSAGRQRVAALGEALLVQLLFDGELQRLFDGHAVEVVEVGRVLGGADGGLELVGVELDRRLAAEEQRFALVLRHRAVQRFDEALRQQEPVERLAADQVAVAPLADGLLGQAATSRSLRGARGTSASRRRRLAAAERAPPRHGGASSSIVRVLSLRPPSLNRPAATLLVLLAAAAGTGVVATRPSGRRRVAGRGHARPPDRRRSPARAGARA